MKFTPKRVIILLAIVIGIAMLSGLLIQTNKFSRYDDWKEITSAIDGRAKSTQSLAIIEMDCPTRMIYRTEIKTSDSIIWGKTTHTTVDFDKTTGEGTWINENGQGRIILCWNGYYYDGWSEFNGKVLEMVKLIKIR